MPSRTPLNPTPRASLVLRATLLPTCAAFLFLGITATANASYVRITAINGKYDPRHGNSVDARPGDVVQLSADLLEDRTNASTGAAVEEFTWRAFVGETQLGKDCIAANPVPCLYSSPIEVNDAGVGIYLDGTRDLTITVTSNSNGTQDQIFIHNLYDSESGYIPPTQIARNPGEYNQSVFDPHRALQGLGRWVVLDDVRYFVPYTYGADWTPNQNGYWTYAQDSWSWVSYDPWGWVTDHHGAWRHHTVYGWMWTYEDLQYKPSQVVWVYSRRHIGWYPYNQNLPRAYRHGEDHGFNDGYWQEFNPNLIAQNQGLGYGFTIVLATDFMAPNTYPVAVSDLEKRRRFLGKAVQEQNWGKNLFGISTPDSRRQWEAMTRKSAVVTTLQEKRVGQTILSFPAPVYQTPEAYRFPLSAQRFNQPISLGSMIGPSEEIVSPTLPSEDGFQRGIIDAPIYRRYQQGEWKLYRAGFQTLHPAIANPANPVYRPGGIEPVSLQPPVTRPFPGDDTVEPVWPPSPPPVVRPLPGDDFVEPVWPPSPPPMNPTPPFETPSPPESPVPVEQPRPPGDFLPPWNPPSPVPPSHWAPRPPFPGWGQPRPAEPPHWNHPRPIEPPHGDRPHPVTQPAQPALPSQPFQPVRPVQPGQPPHENPQPGGRPGHRNPGEPHHGNRPTQPQPGQPTPAKPEQPKPQPVQPAPVKPEQPKPQPVQPAPVKPEQPKPQPVQPAPAKPEQPKPQPVQPAPVKPEQPRPQPTQPPHSTSPAHTNPPAQPTAPPPSHGTKPGSGHGPRPVAPQ